MSGTIGFTVGQKIRQKSGNCGDTLVYNGILGSNTFFQTWIGRKLKTLKIDEKVDLKLQQQKKVKMQKKTHYFRTIFLWQHCLVSCSLFTIYIFTYCLFTYIYEKYQQKYVIGNFHRVNFWKVKISIFVHYIEGPLLCGWSVWKCKISGEEVEKNFHQLLPDIAFFLLCSQPSKICMMVVAETWNTAKMLNHVKIMFEKCKKCNLLRFSWWCLHRLEIMLKCDVTNSEKDHQ